MALVQYLLVRALVARFWKEAPRSRLIRWGAALHDRFMLPHHLAIDVGEVVSDLNVAEYPFAPEWLTPFLERRFPLCGTVDCGVVELELRHALEPWPVLGEAATAGGTSRAVDASLDRVQVKLTGRDVAHHAVLCNGRRVPLQVVGSAEAVAGVRYRARRFPSMLHPTIEVHAPLTFDVVDARSARSLGGCTYHAADPGGPGHERPAASDAEARRRARFQVHGPGAGVSTLRAEPANPGAPCTLDLRFQPGPP
jgi:uncharacterized protein (DUF2126 family)